MNPVLRKINYFIKSKIYKLKTFFECHNICIPVTAPDSIQAEFTTPFELRKVFEEDRVHYENIECPPDFKEPGSFHIILADDNAGALALLEIDLEIIIGSSRIQNIPRKTLDAIEVFKNSVDPKTKFELQKIGGDYATYSIYRKAEELGKEYRIDFAIIDIVFGGIVYKDNSPIRIDGVDLAVFLREQNPNIEIILFTGSDLDHRSKEYHSILEKFGKEFIDTNVVFKNPDFTERLGKFTKRIQMAYDRFVKEKSWTR